eukprot:8161367-Pyramimonas_sp.AAC.1
MGRRAGDQDERRSRTVTGKLVHTPCLSAHTDAAPAFARVDGAAAPRGCRPAGRRAGPSLSPGG